LAPRSIRALLAAFRKQIAAFDAGLALGPHPVRPLRLPFGDIVMPAYFIPAVGYAPMQMQYAMEVRRPDDGKTGASGAGQLTGPRCPSGTFQ
jgi:hypothetical protein